MDVRAKLQQWDYLIVTASNEAQARAYESQLKARQNLGLLGSVRDVMVVPDPGGKRIGSGMRLLQEDHGVSHLQTFLDINNEITGKGVVKGTSSWVEGCRINSSLTLGGGNMAVGIDIDEPISLPPGACLDVIKGRNRNGRRVWFIHCYNLDDTFKETIKEDCTFCGLEVFEWLNTIGAEPEELWDADLPAEKRSIWDARFFPAVNFHGLKSVALR